MDIPTEYRFYKLKNYEIHQHKFDSCEILTGQEYLFVFDEEVDNPDYFIKTTQKERISSTAKNLSNLFQSTSSVFFQTQHL